VVRHAYAVGGLVEGGLELAADRPRALLRRVLPGNEHWNESRPWIRILSVGVGWVNSYLALAVGFFGVESDAEIFVERWGGGVERASGLLHNAGWSKEASTHHS